jgi:hypothetical protein
MLNVQAKCTNIFLTQTRGRASFPLATLNEKEYPGVSLSTPGSSDLSAVERGAAAGGPLTRYRQVGGMYIHSGGSRLRWYRFYNGNGRQPVTGCGGGHSRSATDWRGQWGTSMLQFRSSLNWCHSALGCAAGNELVWGHSALWPGCREFRVRSLLQRHSGRDEHLPPEGRE